MRERYLEEMTLSLVISCLLSVFLCNVLPNIERGIDAMAMFIIFWLIGTYCVWTVIEIIDDISERRN